MKKIILIFSCFTAIVFSVISFDKNFSSVFAEEALWPQEDFDLIYGMYRIPNLSDPAPIDKDYRILFVFYPLSITDGKIPILSIVELTFLIILARKILTATVLSR